MGFLIPKVPKPRRFTHIPIYYDPEKEKIKELEEKYAENENGEYKIKIKRGSFRKQTERSLLSKHEQERRRRMRKLIIALCVLLAFVIFIIAYSGNFIALFFEGL
jgi:hypothetical protein